MALMEYRHGYHRHHDDVGQAKWSLSVLAWFQEVFWVEGSM